MLEKLWDTNSTCMPVMPQYTKLYIPGMTTHSNTSLLATISSLYTLASVSCNHIQNNIHWFHPLYFHSEKLKLKESQVIYLWMGINCGKINQEYFQWTLWGRKCPCSHEQEKGNLMVVEKTTTGTYLGATL